MSFTRNVVDALPGFMPDVGRIFWMLEDARRRTQTVLDGLAPAALDWRERPDGHTIGTLLYHIAAIELDWLHAEVLEDGVPDMSIWDLFTDEVRDANGRLTLITGHEMAWYSERLVRVRELMRSAYRDMTPEAFRHVRRLPQYDVSPEWVLHHLCQHESEHRAEIMALKHGAGQAR